MCSYAQTICEAASGKDPQRATQAAGAGVWRYFRHTWSLEYRSIPGRKLPLLIRNRAHPTLPVIGIAMLAGPIIRSATREDWIGWSYDRFIELLSNGERDTGACLEALGARIDLSIKEIRWGRFNVAGRSQLSD